MPRLPGKTAAADRGPRHDAVLRAARPETKATSAGWRRELFMLASAIDHPSLGLHVSTAALAANDETGHKNFAARRGRLDHVHIDEPGLVALGASGNVDHADVRRHLSAISYTGWCSVVQRLRPGLSPTDLVFRSVRGFKAMYRQDFRNRRTFHV